ncbi:MAG TPA: L,D-transpeptidase [Pyrinomonadaceae bacterium]|jgi:lipoprotein-anchoring transpeptidase ErfK/SrfK|nr:L,D-transpeptidase [Pyrinomonadaceae bacterium]
MERILRATRTLALAACALYAAGCVAEPTNNANTTTANTTNTSVATNSAPVTNTSPAPATEASGANRLPVTLPVLDAMFADEKFAGELKSKLQLTDEQVGKLRTIAREQTASLREDANDEQSGTTSAATARAAAQVREVVGEAKAEQLAALVRERWSSGGGEEGGGGGANAALSEQPNAVPTDTRVVVNAPAYRMDVFENGKLVKSYKVGIGYPEFPLPTGLRKANTIIFNPTWTPPDEPWVEGSNKVKPGQKVEAGSKLNPLGLLKIPIGSPSLIHGGKSAAKLGTFASHGCVGLTDALAQDFAQLLAQIGGAEVKKEEILAYSKKRDETKNVKLAQPVPVELRYETIVAEDGKLHIYRDVYDHDTNTEENLRKVLQAQGISLDQLSEQERTQVLDALKAMARDATGKPTDATPAASPTPAANKNQNTQESGKVTRTIKGQKEVVVEIAALQGKGYPAPVGGGFTAPKAQGNKNASNAKPQAGGTRRK